MAADETGTLVQVQFSVYRPLYVAAKELSGGDLSNWTHGGVSLALSYFDAAFDGRRLVFETAKDEFEPLTHFDELRREYVPEMPMDDSGAVQPLEMLVDSDRRTILGSLLRGMSLSESDFFNAAYALRICYDRCMKKGIGVYIEEDDPVFGRVLAPVEVRPAAYAIIPSAPSPSAPPEPDVIN